MPPQRLVQATGSQSLRTRMAMEGTFDPRLVALSFVVAVGASYTALELSRRVSHSTGTSARAWLIAGSMSMGIGIWTMHFIGMLALDMPMSVRYDVPITMASLGVAVAASAYAIYIAAGTSNSLPRIGASGLLLGCGIAGMHYTGMAAMRMDAQIVYEPRIVGLSVAIAVAAACAAIWIMFKLVNNASRHLGKLKFGAALIMGIAICGMHYTGMAAVSYVRIGPSSSYNDPMANMWLAITMGGAALLILGFTNLTIFFERQLRREQEHSHKVEQEAVRLSDVLDESSNEIYFFDSESHAFVKANRGALSNLGYSLDELKAMTPLDILSDFDVASLNDLLRPLRNGEVDELLVETTHRRRDGSEYQAQVHLQLSKVTEPPLFVAVNSDITERKNLEMQLVQAQKMESIGQLAAGIAHEINTPAQFVGDNTRFIKDSFEDLLELNVSFGKLFEAAKSDEISADLIDQVDAAMKAADLEYLTEEIPAAIDQSLDGISRISNIVRAMKEFSHPGGKDRESTDLNNAIANTITVASNEWKYVATIDTDFADNLPPIMCYQQEVNQVILNLIVNAAHAIESGRAANCEDKGVIRIATRALDAEVEVTVSDTGCGIPDEIKTRIFDPFFTTKEVGKGTGQGLAMAYRTIVEQHRGFLGVDSTPGTGTTFTIRLPITADDPLHDEVAA